MKLEKGKYFNRELSWLSFNYRVLQEAINKEVPLIERLRFLAIYSSNLDEFFRVRVASYKYLLRIQKDEDPQGRKAIKNLIKQIVNTVEKQQQQFGEIFNDILIPELKEKDIFLIDQKELNEQQIDFLKNYYKNEIAPHISLVKMDVFEVFLENKGLYFAIETVRNGTSAATEHYLMNIPTNKTKRFIVLPDTENKHVVIQLADVMRLFIPEILPEHEVKGCYAIKLTRDAELYLEEEIDGTVLDKIKASLYKRKVGSPSRLLYDEKMPKAFVKMIRKRFGLQKDDLIAGGRYHNFNDFFSFPISNREDIVYEPLPELEHPSLSKSESMFESISKQDQILHFPYQTYSNVVRLIKEAAKDDQVEQIKITLYRVADKSKICKALINAAKKGKDVFVFNEVKARFDEESNIFWGGKMQKAGINVSYSMDHLKVHSKVCLIYRRENNELVKYAYFGTGNFNEKTAGIYCDHALLTMDKRLTSELDEVFQILEKDKEPVNFQHLLVAPFNMRDRFIQLIDREIENAVKGIKAKMILKMNSLSDRIVIDKLYDASNAGVEIKIIVRGICCLVPGVEGMSENIKVISIVDRYLEHGRIYIFHNGGEELIFLASADWMTRNLSRRIEVGFPVYDKRLQREIKTIIRLQLKDNTKARTLNITQSNPYKRSVAKKRVRAQYDAYYYLKNKLQETKLTKM